MVVAGYYGFGNAGDELLLRAIVQELRRAAPPWRIVALSQDPSRTIREQGIEAVDRWRPWAWMPVLAQADRLILGGGGLLQESTGPFNHAYYLSLVLVAKLFGCRTEMRAMGIDRIRNPFNRWMTRLILRWAVDDISVRDDASRKSLADVGLRRMVALRRDPVFDLDVKLPAGEGRGVAVILAGGSSGPGWPQAVGRAAQRLIHESGVAVDVLVLFPAEDLMVAEATREACPALRKLLVIENPLDLLSVIPQYQWVVSSRFHALVVAAKAGRSFLGLGPQAKIASLCQEYGQPCFPTTTAGAESTFSEFLGLSFKRLNKSVILATRND